MADDTAQPATGAEALVPVATAARELGVDARQVRRYAARLQPPDRTPDGTTPLRVRVEAVRALRSAQKDERTRDRTGVLVSVREAAALRELLAEKDRRIAGLEANLADVRRAYAQLEGAYQDVRRLLPPAEDTGQDKGAGVLPEPPRAADPSVETRQDTGQDQVSAVLPDARRGFVLRADRRPWWALWRKRDG